MSAIYDNWERLVGAVLKKEQLWQLFHADSVSVTSDSSGFSFSSSRSASSVVAGPIEVPEPELRVLGVKRGGEAEIQSYPLPLPPNSRAKPASLPTTPWKKGKLLGHGILGPVYVGFNNENGGMCAMREVPLSFHGDIQQSARILERLSRIRHPNIVNYYGSETVSGNFYVYYEYMSRGTMCMILQQYGKLGEAVISSYTQQILSGLAYLHSKNIAHGNIKGANILIDPKGTVKLSNYGLEKQIAERFCTSWMMDSTYWMAPEAITNPNERNLGVDIWSLGCTILEMATSKPPVSQYKGVSDSTSKVARYKDVPRIPDQLSEACKDFVRRCLQWNPLHRATTFQLLEHPFVKGFSPLGERRLLATKSGGTIDHDTKPGKLVSHPHLTSTRFLKQHTNSNSPSYWDPIILQGVLRF